MRGPGVEPGSSAWKAEIITDRPSALQNDIFRKVLKVIILLFFMRILYGVCGEGFGHSAIASEVIPFLEKKGHKIKVVTYEKGLIFLKGFDIVPVKGLILKYEGGKVNYLKTVYLNAINFPKNFLKIGQIKKIIEEFNPELCITDNEPIVAQTAYLKKIPLISLSALNNFVFDDLRKPVSKLASSTLAKAIVLAITPKADVRIAISLSDRTYEKKGVMFTSPTIREAIRKSVVKKENFILAYLAKSHEHLLKFLEKIPEKFLVYGIKERRKIKNISFEDRHETFADNFGKCKAIIANSGYSVITEAIYLKTVSYTHLTLPTIYSV